MNARAILISCLFAMGGCASSVAPTQDQMSDDARASMMQHRMEGMANMPGASDHQPSGQGEDMAAMHEHMGMMHTMTDRMAQEDMPAPPADDD